MDVLPYVYIFNFENNGGFAIVSGDKRTAPVFAVTDSGNFDPNKKSDNPGLMLFLDNMEELYRADLAYHDKIDQGGQLKVRYEYSDWISLVTSTNPEVALMEWSQGVPYNNLSPYIEGIKAPAGCVATAVAQLCAYYKFPRYYNGYFYNWTEMVKHRSRGSYMVHTPAYSQIARFFQQISTPNNLNMNFGSKVSSAYSSDIPRTLRNLGFANPGIHESYDTEKVFTELRKGYPVLVSGSSTKEVKKYKFMGITFLTVTSFAGGHQWILDDVVKKQRKVTQYINEIKYSSDFQTTVLVHCNWGWNGADDGYYYSKAFNVNSGSVYEPSYNFKYKLDMVHGIRRQYNQILN